MDEALLSHVRSHVHIMVTDAVSAELLASDILRSRRRSDQAELQRDVFFPKHRFAGPRCKPCLHETAETALACHG